jgi:hypothetical protein
MEAYSAPVSIGATFGLESGITFTLDIPQASGLRSISEMAPYTSEVLIAEPVITDGAFIGEHVWSDFEGGDGATQSYGIDQGCAAVARMLQIHFESSYGMTIPSGWEGTRVFKVYRSDDNSAWTHVEDFTDPTIVHDENLKFHIRLVFSNPVASRYFKVVSTGAVNVEQYINGQWYYESVMVSEILASGTIFPDNINFLGQTITAALSLQAYPLLSPEYASHEQALTVDPVIVTLEAPYGYLSLSDDKDALTFESGADLTIADAQDVLSFTAIAGLAGTLSLEDAEDSVAALPGGELSFQDALDSFALSGMSEAQAVFSLNEAVDSLEMTGLSGVVAELDAVDASDLFVFTGQPTTTGGMSLVDSIDTFSMDALPGSLASLSLADIVDAFSMTGFVHQTSVLAILDDLDVFTFSARPVNPFTDHIIQYQKSRY